ncbi:GspE/PulE family protein [Otariodibacter sp.]|uniref:GspE/PulE family protein n=1 Tax=Otariodibacter sp. TaxID=3030919 RepID=UPI002633CC8F|nr:GspE/PulE family protein [Otariodibacter sp.]
MSSIYSVCEISTQQIFTITEELWQENCENKHILQRYLAIPVKETSDTLWLAIDDQNNFNASDSFAFMHNKKIEQIIISSEELKYLLNTLSPKNDFTDEFSDINYGSEKPTSKLDYNEPIIQILDNLFKFCLQQNASDIHIEPAKDKLIIRLRIDGLLQVYKTLPQHLANRLILKIKLLANLDISESRQPQDGQFSFTTVLSEYLDFRVSTLPTYHGEKLVLRLQKDKPVQLDFITLGFTPQQKETLLQALSQPQGLILVTGPTGSGKSITLYTALNHLNQIDKHILTAEDPIEIEIEGLIQTQVNASLNLTFSKLLKTFLRQDPDIIMLGEIRDPESAKIALSAAQTGHLVLSTLHTNDAPSAIDRLIQLGIDEYEIRNSLLLVIAQRLVRKLCNKCLGKSCNHCYQGYKGRVGVYQCLSRSAKEFDKQTACLDYSSLYLSAKQKIESNQTNLAEIKRVLGYA